MTDFFYEIFQTMRNNKLRTILTGIAVSWGIMMLMVLVSISQSIIDDFLSSDFAKSPNNISLYNGYAAKPWEGLKSGRSVPLRESNVATLQQSLPEHIQSAHAELSGQATFSTINEAINEQYAGVTPETAVTQSIKMSRGRFINDSDLAGNRKVLVMESTTVRQLFSDTLTAVGKYVNINDIPFQLVGYYTHEWNTQNYIPYTTAKTINGYTDKVTPIRVILKDINTAAQSDSLEKDIRTILGKVNHHAPDDSSALWIWNQFSAYLSALGGMSILSNTMWIIGILTLLTGIIGVSNIMFVSVRERTHEIGIRRAIGAPPYSILMQIIAESIVLTTIFGYIGILLGAGAIEAVGHVISTGELNLHPKINFDLAVNVTIVMIVSGAVAGLFPALKALKINPVEALRSE